MRSKRLRWTGIAVLAAALACKGDPTEAPTAGTLRFQFSTSSGVAFHVTQVAVTLRRDGVPDINFTLQDQGDGTFSGSRSNIDVGTYTATIRGLDGGQVEFFGQTSVTIVADQESAVAMTLNSFVPTINAITPTTSLDFTISGTGVPDGESYLIEAARLPDFSSGVLQPVGQSQNGNNFAADFTAPTVGTYYVRVTAQRGDISEPGKPALGIAPIITGTLVYGDLIASTIDAPGELEVYSFEATAGTDGPMVVSFPVGGAAPPDMDMTVGPFGDVRYGGNKDAGVVGNTNLEWVVAFEPVSPAPDPADRHARFAGVVVPPRDAPVSPKSATPSYGAMLDSWQRLTTDPALRMLGTTLSSSTRPPSTKTIEVTGALFTTGGFNLALDNCDVVEATFGNVIATGLLTTDCIALNPLSGNLSYGFYAYFSGTAGQDVAVNLASGDFDATLFLFGPNGDLIAAKDDGGYGADERITMTLPTTGTYIAFPSSYEDLVIGALDLVVTQTTPGIPASLQFSFGPSNTAVGGTIPIEVTVLDAMGNRVANATNPVTLAFAVNPGRLLLRASGESGDDPKLQPLEPKAPAVYPTLPGSQANEIWGMSYDPTLEAVVAADFNGDLTAIDPVTGAQILIGVLTESIRALGRAADGRLIGGGSPSLGDDQVYEVNPLTAATTLIGSGSVTISGDVINGFHGLATDPTDGTLWGLVSLVSAAPPNKTRYLVTVDLSASPSPAATMVATVSELGTADIAFFPDGTMYAITGNGAPSPETLWTVNTTTGAMTSIFILGPGGFSSVGESIATIRGQLTGPLTVLPGSGVAVFNGVAINAPAVGYQLIATSPGLTGAVSVLFNIN